MRFGLAQWTMGSSIQEADGVTDRNTGMFTVADVARWLSVSEQTVRKLASEDEIPHVRLPSGALRFDREQLQEWIDSRTRGAQRGPRVPEPRGELVDDD